MSIWGKKNSIRLTVRQHHCLSKAGHAGDVESLLRALEEIFIDFLEKFLAGDSSLFFPYCKSGHILKKGMQSIFTIIRL